MKVLSGRGGGCTHSDDGGSGDTAVTLESDDVSTSFSDWFLSLST